MQQIAYNVLAPLGVPVTQPKPAPAGTHPTTPHGQPSPSAVVAVPGSPSHTASGPSASATATPTGHHPTSKATTTTVTRPVLRLVALKVYDRLVVVAPSDKAGDTVHLTELVGGDWTTVAAKPLGPKHRAFFLLPKTAAAGHLFRAEIPQAKKKVASASNRLWIPRLPKTGAKGIKPSPGPTTTASTTPDASATPIVTAIPSPSTTSLPPPPCPADHQPFPDHEPFPDRKPEPERDRYPDAERQPAVLAIPDRFRNASRLAAAAASHLAPHGPRGFDRGLTVAGVHDAGLSSFQWPSETTSMLPSVTLMAV